MTEQELIEAISEGRLKNRTQDFWDEALKQTGKKRRCPTVYKAAWSMYVESMKDAPIDHASGLSVALCTEDEDLGKWLKHEREATK